LKNSRKTSTGYSLYGPVPSRRLGFSLGIDIIPFKTCTFDCVYCQLGSCSEKKIERQTYFPAEDILPKIKKALDSDQKIDAITFSGSGEPTLNADIGELIKEIKKVTQIPIVVLTNSSLMNRSSVRKALLQADIVIPSLDAVDPGVFQRINRPHPSLKVKDIIKGLQAFRSEFKGTLWLEILLVKGINDSPSHIQKLKKAIKKIKPDRIQLNTVIRPPAENTAHPLELQEMQAIKDLLGENCEIIAEFSREEQKPVSQDLKETVLSLIQRRPVTLSDISKSLGLHRNEALKFLDALMNEKRIKSVVHKGLRYFETENLDTLE
jgi:wyosine [tRNA(Phe)-imidazoG37] synthetase (radical SAM superfamily)